MIDALAQGQLYGRPEERTASNGNRYARGRVRVPTKDGTLWVSFMCFHASHVKALLALSDGDSVAMSGELSVGIYTPLNGEPRPNLNLVVHSITSVFHVRRKRTATDKISGTLPFGDRLETYGTGT